MKGARWWNNDVKGKVNEKKETYTIFMNSGTNVEKEISKVRHKAVKKVDKKTVVVAKNMACDKLYQKMEIKEGENELLSWRRLGKEELGTWVL